MHQEALERYPRALLQLTLWAHQLLHPRKLIVEIQTLRVEQRARRLDNLARYDMLHWQLDLFEVYSCLVPFPASVSIQKSVLECSLRCVLPVFPASQTHISARVAG
jgi:hypothetical protein